jgi:hypothetical protein
MRFGYNPKTRLFLQVTKIQFDQIRDVSFIGLY